MTITPGGITHPMASAAVSLVLAAAHRLRRARPGAHDGRLGAGRFVPQGTGLRGPDARRDRLRAHRTRGRAAARALGDARARHAADARNRGRGRRTWRWTSCSRESDVVVVACPLTEATRGLLDARRLGLMRPTAFLVNVARGADRRPGRRSWRRCASGRLAGAGLDVVDPEPLPADDPLLGLPNVVGAPHSLGYTRRAASAAASRGLPMR